MCYLDIAPCLDTSETCRTVHSNIDICLKRWENPGGSASSHIFVECIQNNPACKFEGRSCEAIFRRIWLAGIHQ